MGRKMPSVDSNWPPRSKDVGGPSKPCNATAGSDLIWSAPATTAGDPSMPSATPSPATPGCHPPQHDQLKNTPDWIPANGRLIGSSRYHGHDPDRREVEIGWTFLARSYWGGTYNRELKRLMLRHAFRFVDTVVFLVGPANLRSQRAVEGIGGVRSGSRPDRTGAPSLGYRIESRNWFDVAG